MRSTRVKWVIALAVVVSGIWFMGVMYVMTYSPDVYVNPGITGSNLPSVSAPMAKPITTYTPTRLRGTYSPAHYGTSRVQRPSAVPMQSMRIRTTSSAEVHSIGGGGAGGGVSSSGGSSSRGIVYSTASVAMPQTNFIAMASSRQMAAPEASEAPAMAKVTGMRRAPGPPNPGENEDLPGNHQITEQPVGDAVLPLMLLLMAYCGVIALRRKNALES